jgi:hypothetical protein
MTLESFPSNVSIVLLVLRKSVVGKTLALWVTDLLHAIQIQTWLVSTLRSIGPASRTERHDKLPNSVGLLDCWKFPSISCPDSIKNVFKLNFQGLSNDILLVQRSRLDRPSIDKGSIWKDKKLHDCLDKFSTRPIDFVIRL